MPPLFASLLLLLGTNALANEPAADSTASTETRPSPEPQPSQDQPWRLGSRNRIYGVVGLEAALAGIDGRIEDVSMISARYEQGIDAPTRSYLEHREGQWNRTFGRRRLHVRHERVSDGEALIEVTAVTHSQRIQGFGQEKREFMCTQVAIDEQRALELVTWDDQARSVIGESDKKRRAEQTAFFLVDGQQSRTAMIHLAPGESATVVEVFEGNRNKNSRKIEVQRGERTLTMVETDQVRKVCLEL